MKPATQKRLTKRQRKELRGPNSAMQNSVNHGSTIERAGATYKGRNPEYHVDPLTKMPVKSRAGIPFVRVS